MNRLVRSLTALSLIVALCALLLTAQLSYGRQYRVLSPDECQDINGGECLTLTVVYVVGAACSIVALGWMVLEETWDRPDPGSQLGGINTYPTQIRQATQQTEQTCQTIQQFNEVFEGYLQ